jgi:phage repressor protein C with HTH and peptisase S24 domain
MSALSHAQIWGAIDALAARLALSPSSLARLAGLDATIFNRSKRLSRERPPRPRWPSTESLAKVLQATGVSFAEFAALADGVDGPDMGGLRNVPLMGYDEAAQAGHFDEIGHPIGSGWDLASVPSGMEEGAFALEITGDGMAPIYRDGDRIVIRPGLEARRGDRVVIRTLSGEMLVGQLAQMTAQTLVLSQIHPDHPTLSLRLTELAWMSRIVWASQ